MPRKRVKSTLTKAEINAKRKAGFQKSIKAGIAKAPSDRVNRASDYAEWWRR